MTFDSQGIVYLAVLTGDQMISPYGRYMLRLWRLDTLDSSAAWSSEVVDWTTDYQFGGLRVDPVSGEPMIFHYAPLRPVPSARLMRKQLP